MLIKEIGRYNYDEYTVIILESIDTDGYFHYWVTLEDYGLIDSVYGVKDRQTADVVWNYISDFIDDIIDRFNGEE